MQSSLPMPMPMPQDPLGVNSACAPLNGMVKVKPEPYDWASSLVGNSGVPPPFHCGDNRMMGPPPGCPNPLMLGGQVKMEPQQHWNVPPMSCEGNLGLPPSVTSSETDQSPAKPKKSKKKKAKDDCASGGSVAVSEGTTCINSGTLSTENSESTDLKPVESKVKQEKITDSMPVKKKRDRFNGMSEEEVMKRTLPDHLCENLDVIIIGINPGLTAAYVGHHYAGPGNHFWKCLYLSGLIPEPMNAYDDFKLKKYGIGFTNIVERTSRGSADLTRKEIKEGAEILLTKIRKFKPKIAVFNGKGIYEIFCGHKNFYIGKQPEPFPGTDTAVFVMPSSSARCSQLPRAIDKVPFYLAVKKLRDYLVGHIDHMDDSEVTFPDLELKVIPKAERLENQLNAGEDITENKKKSKSKRKSEEMTQNMNMIPPHIGGGLMPPGAGANGGYHLKEEQAHWGMLPAKQEPNVPTSGCFNSPPVCGMLGSFRYPPTLNSMPTMDSVFNTPPTLIKQENINDTAVFGMTPGHFGYPNASMPNCGMPNLQSIPNMSHASLSAHQHLQHNGFQTSNDNGSSNNRMSFHPAAGSPTTQSSRGESFSPPGVACPQPYTQVPPCTSPKQQQQQQQQSSQQSFHSPQQPAPATTHPSHPSPYSPHASPNSVQPHNSPSYATSVQLSPYWPQQQLYQNAVPGQVPGCYATDPRQYSPNTPLPGGNYPNQLN